MHAMFLAKQLWDDAKEDPAPFSQGVSFFCSFLLQQQSLEPRRKGTSIYHTVSAL
jgi:hypothetical protein